VRPTKKELKLFPKVSSDEEAVRLMNDSVYGLTASIWTDAALNPQSEEAFLNMMNEIDTGTVFLNRYIERSKKTCGANLLIKLL
jgi:acyl-CoA reductase-like NAD-dependent aldehyde dehydrogenase